MALSLLLGLGAAARTSNGIVLREPETASSKSPVTDTRPFTSATQGSHTVHPDSGWKIKVALDHEGREAGTGPGSRWRSGEKLNGSVSLDWIHLGVEPTRKITSVIVRAFWTSTTHYTSYKVVPIVNPQSRSMLSKLTQPAPPRYEAIPEVRLEWHRAFLPGGGEELYDGGELSEIRREVEGAFPLLETEEAALPSPTLSPSDLGESPPVQHLVLPFSFSLPNSTRVTSSNRSVQAPTNRRELQNFRRSPPASTDSSSDPECDGTIEWTVELLVRFEDEDLDPDSEEPSPPPSPMEELPSFHMATRRSSQQTNASGLLLPSPNLAIQRIVFPFEPNDHHAQDLYSTWRPTCSGTWARVISKINGIPLSEIEDDTPVEGIKIPTFSKDPRDEAIGGSFMGPRRRIQGGLVDTEGGRILWSTYEKRMALQSLMGRAGGWIRSEVSIPFPAIITRHSRTLPILIHLAFVPPLNSTAAFLSKTKPVFVDKALIVLSRRTMTRGGKQDRPHYHLEEVRREEIKLWDESLTRSRTTMTEVRSSFSRRGEYEDGRKHLALVPGQKGKDFKIEFDLQSLGVTPAGKEFSALRDCALSVRTPNIEKEYIISVTLVLSGATYFFSLRAPIQVTAGDFDDLPQFESSTTAPVQMIPQIAMPHDEADLPGYGSL